MLTLAELLLRHIILHLSNAFRVIFFVNKSNNIGTKICLKVSETYVVTKGQTMILTLKIQ